PFGLPPGPTKGQAQQVPGLDRNVCILRRPAPPACPGRMPGRQGLWRHPDRQAAAVLERPVVLWPVGHFITRPGDLVAARLIGLVGHRSSRRRGSWPHTPIPGFAEATGPDLCTKTTRWG